MKSKDQNINENCIKKKVLYVVPVKQEYINLWVWYKIDFNILNDLGYEVIFCNNFKDILLNINKVDVVYGWWWARMFIFTLLCKLLNKRLIVAGALHMFDLSGSGDFYNDNLMKRTFNRICLRYADANILMSKDQFQSITSHIKTKNPKLVYSCTQRTAEELLILKNKKLEWVNKEFKSEKSRNIRISTICWHTKNSQLRKGLILLINSYLYLKKQNLNLPHLTIMGKEGDGIDNLKTFIKENNLNNLIDLKINISIKEKDFIFSNSHFYVQSSWYEGFGNAVLEAMEQGTPAIVSRYSAQPEVVGDAGIINTDQSPESLGNKINDLFKINKSKYIEMVEKGYKRINSLFIYEKRREKFKDIFEEINNI